MQIASKIILIGLVVLLVGVIMWQNLTKERIRLPSGEISGTVTVPRNSENPHGVSGRNDTVGEDKAAVTNVSSGDPEAVLSEGAVAEAESEREVFVTEGVKHSVPLDDIRGGGPPKDGIPSIDDPKFTTPEKASGTLSDDEPGIAFSLGGVNRFYPYQILVWHEIVNDTISGKRVLVTYCPLCLTGYVFDPVVKDERVEFGTSGKLWESNLVMYDRKTDSLWSQVLGEAIVGELTGARLPVLSSDQMRFGNWKKAFPNGEVLSRDTGATRFYGSNPYGDYFDVQDFALSMARPNDTRLANDAFVFGVVVNEKTKAYDTSAVQKKGTVTDSFQGKQFILRYDVGLDVVRMYEKKADGAEMRINPVSGFWFSWVSAHPDTEVYK